MTVHSFNTRLRDRTLWYDGDSSYDVSNLISLMSKYKIKYVNEIDENVKQFNKFCSKTQQLKIKDFCRPLSYDWNIPDEYKKLNIVEYLFQQHAKITKNFSEKEIEKRDTRLIKEIKMYKEKNLFGVLRAMVYIVDTLTLNNIVWGVGRGSCTSSYVLYLIGVHDVDPVTYDLDINDFLHD